MAEAANASYIFGPYQTKKEAKDVEAEFVTKVPDPYGNWITFIYDLTKADNLAAAIRHEQEE